MAQLYSKCNSHKKRIKISISMTRGAVRAFFGGIQGPKIVSCSLKTKRC